jgi:acetate kinase
VPQVACFDTGFHAGHSPVSKLVPLPKTVRESGLQRYGFHGLSYEYPGLPKDGLSSPISEAAPVYVL